MGPTSEAAAKVRPDRTPDGRSVWLTPRAAGMHLTLLVVVPVFVGLFWWQVERVRQGNTLSWAYVFEWPFFTGYAIYMWWKLVHDQADPAGTTAAGTARAAEPGPIDAGPIDAGPIDAGPPEMAPTAPVSPGAVTPRTASPGAASGEAATAGAGAADSAGAAAQTEDEELAAYNRYLAQLDASGRRKRW